MVRRIRSGRSGFTLIELMVVMVIVTVLVSDCRAHVQKSIIKIERNGFATIISTPSGQ